MDMPKNLFKQRLREKRLQIGLFVGLASHYSMEILAGAGFDWLVIDAEHTPNNPASVLPQLQAAASYSPQLLVRPMNHDPALIKQYLDIGAQTLMLPLVDDAEQAGALVRAMRYPPQGIRGVASSMARAACWNGVEGYVRQANDEVCLLLQAETATALQNLEAICAVDGVHGIFIGPADLAASMGHRGNPGHPEVQAAIAGAMKTIIASGKAAGTLTSDPTLAQRYLDLGCTFVAVGVDVLLFVNAARRLRGQFAGSGAAPPASGPSAAY